MTTMAPVREVTDADVDAVLDLLTLVDLAEIGEASSTIDEIRNDLGIAGFRSVAVDHPSGGLAGYAWAQRPPEHTKVYGDVLVRPGSDVTLAQRLFAWLREQAAVLGPDLPLRVFSDSGNAMKRGILEEAGAVAIRRFYRMLIDFEEAPLQPVPALPAGVGIRTVTGDEADFRAMHAVVDTAFLDHFGHEPEAYEHWARSTITGQCSDHSLWWLATVDGVPAAGLYACALPSTGYVDTLGTLREHRGRGLGRALLLTAFHEFRRRGHAKVALGVDATNPTGALGLYESVGMRPAHEGLAYELSPQ